MPERIAHRKKSRELLQMANIGPMKDIQSLLNEAISEFMENGLEAELDDEQVYSKYDTRIRTPATAAAATAVRRRVPALRSGWIGSPRPEEGI